MKFPSGRLYFDSLGIFSLFLFLYVGSCGRGKNANKFVRGLGSFLVGLKEAVFARFVGGSVS